jgi:hypothetical protein
MKWERPELVEIGMNAEIGGYQQDLPETERPGPKGPTVESASAVNLKPHAPARERA